MKYRLLPIQSILGFFNISIILPSIINRDGRGRISARPLAGPCLARLYADRFRARIAAEVPHEYRPRHEDRREDVREQARDQRDGEPSDRPGAEYEEEDGRN